MVLFCNSLHDVAHMYILQKSLCHMEFELHCSVKLLCLSCLLKTDDIADWFPGISVYVMWMWLVLQMIWVFTLHGHPQVLKLNVQ